MNHVNPEAVLKIKASLACKNKLAVAHNCSYKSIERWIKESIENIGKNPGIMFTTAISMAVIRKELHLTDMEILSAEVLHEVNGIAA